MKRILSLLFLVICFIVFVTLGVNNVVESKQKLQLKDIQLQDANTELKVHQLKSQELNQKLEIELQKDIQDIERIKQLEEENRQHQDRTRELEAQLQAKREEKERLAKLQVTPKAYAATGSCDDWIVAAGITEIAAARELINRESGCNPYSRNPSSGACGVAQELPCGKSGCSLGDGACQVKWMATYVASRYGSWGAAVEFHDRNNYY